MSRLDTLEGIRQYREDIARMAEDVPNAIVGMKPGSMLELLDTLLAEIDRRTDPSHPFEGVTVTPLGKTIGSRHEAPDLLP